MKHAVYSAMLLGAAITSWSRLGQAAGPCSYVVSDMEDSFYGALWGCQQSRIDDMWSRFSMSKSQWSGGWWGYEDVCNDRTPLKRTFNALQLLAYGVTSTPTCSTSDNNMGKWAYCWAGDNIDELTASCSTASRAQTAFGPIIDNYTELRIPFFRDETVAQRAGTIVHEARHANGWCKHDGTPCIGKECDPSFDSHGCVGAGSSSGFGAYGYQALYLNWFASTARANWINDSIRADAVAEANRILRENFTTPSCRQLNSSGFMVSVC